MGILQTAERSSNLDPSENVIFQRHMIAYIETAKMINGKVLEIGCGEGYGLVELAPKAEQYLAVDKYNTPIMGANDGASGVAILMEFASIFNNNRLNNIGIDLLFVVHLMFALNQFVKYLSFCPRFLKSLRLLFQASIHVLCLLPQVQYHIK